MKQSLDVVPAAPLPPLLIRDTQHMFLQHKGGTRRYTTTSKRKSFGELFWPQRNTFQAGGNTKKTRKTISTTEIFPLWPPFFSAKKSSSLEQCGVCCLFKAFSPKKGLVFAVNGASAPPPPPLGPPPPPHPSPPPPFFWGGGGFT